MPTRPDPTLRSNRGFTTLEMLMVIAILLIGAGMAMVLTPQVVAFARSDSAASVVVSTLRTAREQAISQRRDIRVVFVAPNSIQVLREEIPGPTLTLLTEVRLEGTTEFTQFAAVPDTPDAFGAAGPIDFGGALSLQFTSEGTFVDEADDPVNGTVFVGNVGDPLSARAITLFGPTAIIRQWRWDGRQWFE